MLVSNTIEITFVGCVIALATNTAQYHGKRTAMPRAGAVRIGAVNGVALMGQDVPWQHQHWDHQTPILVAVIRNALGKTQRCSALMGTHALEM